MAKLTDEQLVALVDAEFTSAMGAPGGEISMERAKAWDYYLSKPFGDEIEGRSSVVTSDVADVVDSVMPSLLRLFTMADNLVGFDAVGPEDEEAAEQESDYVNYVFFKKNPAFEIMYSWFFDALVQKNGIVKAYWDDSEIITTESYEGLTEAELFDLLTDDELELVERSEREMEVPDMTGTVLVPATVHDVQFRRVSKTGRARVENVPPEEYRISSDARSLNPSSARMVGHERPITRSELIDMKFDADIVADLPAHGTLQTSDEQISRRDKSDETRDGHNDRSQDEILVREAYMRVDVTGDGRAELRQIFTAGNRLLSNEPADRQPFHVISPQPLPHKHFGRATAEKVMDVERVQSTLLRQTLDNLYHTNNPGHAVWEQGMGDDTLDDLLTTRVGRTVRFARPVGESYMPMTVPFTAAATFPMLEFWDRVKRDRTGVSSDSEGLSPEALKNIQTSVMGQAHDISRMKLEAIARIFAETGIKSLFLHIHELLLKHQQKAQVVKLRNRWIEVNPQEWRTRMDMTVNVGLGIGTRDQNLLHLNAIFEKQAAAVAAGLGGTLVTPKNVHTTLAEIVKNTGRKVPDLFFTDPGDAEFPSGDQDGIAQAQLQIAQRQQELDAAKLEMDREKAALQHEREIARLVQGQEKIRNDLLVEMEKIANALTELELKYSRDVPGSRV